MKKIVAFLFLTLAIAGCAHKELKAPCANVASLTSETIPCDKRQPVNATSIPSVFAN